jgi:uncharacterized protein YqhQ
MAELPVGGQAVIEGVMMRSPNCLAVAVRTPKGRLLVRQRRWISLATKLKFLRWPFFRGILVLAESLHNGISTLNFAAQVQEQGLQELEAEKGSGVQGPGSGGEAPGVGTAGSGQWAVGSGPEAPDATAEGAGPGTADGTGSATQAGRAGGSAVRQREVEAGAEADARVGTAKGSAVRQREVEAGAEADARVGTAKGSAVRQRQVENTPSLWITLAVAIVMALALFAALPHFLTWGLGWLLGSNDLASGKSFLFQVVDGVIKLAIFLGYVWGISFIPDIRRVFMYHGAEHKCIYAFEKGLDLTVANADVQTTLHPRCGTSFLLVVLLIAILVFTVVFPFIPPVSEIGALNQAFFVLVKLFLLFPIAGVSYEIIRLAGKRPDHRLLRMLIWPGLATQRITTRIPDSAQLEVAMASLLTVLDAERAVASDPTQSAEERQAEYEDFAAFQHGRKPV